MWWWNILIGNDLPFCNEKINKNKLAKILLLVGVFDNVHFTFASMMVRSWDINGGSNKSSFTKFSCVLSRNELDFTRCVEFGVDGDCTEGSSKRDSGNCVLHSSKGRESVYVFRGDTHHESKTSFGRKSVLLVLCSVAIHVNKFTILSLERDVYLATNFRLKIETQVIFWNTSNPSCMHEELLCALQDRWREW